jgi:hypothetical protein
LLKEVTLESAPKKKNKERNYLGKRVATGMNDPLSLGENIIKCGVNVTVVYLRY